MKPDSFKAFINTISVVSMGSGLLGMLICFVYLWSYQMRDIVAAGFAFVAGSILFGAGLVALAMMNRQKSES
ncbi:hypothetical protein [Rufibacter roseus]|uniref:Uncharacterized protein n=1 Tax=Rufibacter roseus TaxID=1567108 RepID=A0ABW2DQ39_9BACT|nr:hypothetical protein [Rufibacter roseus]